MPFLSCNFRLCENEVFKWWICEVILRWREEEIDERNDYKNARKVRLGNRIIGCISHKK